MAKINKTIKKITIEVVHHEDGSVGHNLVVDVEKEDEQVRGVEVIAILNQGIEMVLSEVL